jgi:hypothetical protein
MCKPERPSIDSGTAGYPLRIERRRLGRFEKADKGAFGLVPGCPEWKSTDREKKTCDVLKQIKYRVAVRRFKARLEDLRNESVLFCLNRLHTRETEWIRLRKLI